jgi:GT2 family glycosyltransferase
MITIVYSTHKNTEYNQKFKKNLIDKVGLSDVQILEYININQYSLAQLYNRGISESKYDIVVCLHNDVKLSKDWGKKLLSDFENNPEFGIIGKAGSTHFPESGVYWEKMHQTMVGQVYHHPPNEEKFLSRYSPKLEYIIPVVTIDGLFISFNKNKIKHTFDESIGKFHFYDHPFCLSNYLDGVKIGVTSSFEITHESVGKPNEEFFISKNIFLEKYGKHLPLNINTLPPHTNIVRDYKNKKKNKVAVIIPTKGNIDILFDCIDSFYDHCNPEHFKMFVADTGSKGDEKQKMREKFLSLPNIEMIEYNYYNFSKINNDVVKHHVGDNFNFLLFCNNDVKLLTNVIDSMLMTFDENPKAGTVGARLHYPDNTIQHDGIFVSYEKSNGLINLGHFGLHSNYNFTNKTRVVPGNTAALLMIRKKTFEKIGMFNEGYINCFEDVELNLKTIMAGLKNYLDNNSVAYHYESKTRGEDPQNIEKLNIDYKERLFPFIVSNLHKLQGFVSIR